MGQNTFRWLDFTTPPVVQHGFYAEAFGTPSLFGNGRWPWYNL